jgi:hypothetical protein
MLEVSSVDTEAGLLDPRIYTDAEAVSMTTGACFSVKVLIRQHMALQI